MDLIDIGANLISKQFRSDLPDVLARAAGAGVTQMIVTGTHLDVTRGAIELCQSHQHLRATAGVHPHHADDLGPQQLAELESLAAAAQVVALGECGLDYNRNFSTPENQRRAFSDQLALAAKLDLPLFLHERDAHDDFVSLLRDAWPDLRRGAVVHCFTGGPAQAEAYLDLGAHLGVTGWVCDERRGGDLRTAVPLIPADRLLIETDAPYLLPRTIRPKPASRRCEPMHLVHVAAEVAALRKTSAEDIAALTSANARAFFGLEGS